MQTFTAIRVHQNNDQLVASYDEVSLDDLASGDVVIKSEFSGINFKDALAVTGKGKIMRSFPTVAGIDVAGEVVQSSNPLISVGQKVVVTGCGLGETQDGGYSEYVRVPAEWVVALPENISTYQAMQLGTAGFTAALAIERMESMGLEKTGGPIAVDGATGGVGSFAINMLSQLGYEVTAISGKQDQADYLRELGAHEIIDSNTLEMGKRPLEKAVWNGAVDNLGGDMLSWLCRSTKPFGLVASIGLAATHELHTSVMPFILRSVSLVGINSVEIPAELRKKVWSRVAKDLWPKKIDAIAHQEVAFSEALPMFSKLMDRKVSGRILIKF